MNHSDRPAPKPERMGVHQRTRYPYRMQASSLAVAGEADAPTLKSLCGLPQSWRHYHRWLLKKKDRFALEQVLFRPSPNSAVVLKLALR